MLILKNNACSLRTILKNVELHKVLVLLMIGGLESDKLLLTRYSGLIGFILASVNDKTNPMSKHFGFVTNPEYFDLV